MQLIFTPMILRLMDIKRRAADGLRAQSAGLTPSPPTGGLRAMIRHARSSPPPDVTAGTTRQRASACSPSTPCEAAKSGHPGMPMGMAEIAEVAVAPAPAPQPGQPAWPDRDRFVLSNGHGSMLLYALLHLTGYDLPMDELKRFRQLHSKTPGHPEVRRDARRRDHDGPARARASPTRSAWRSPRSCSPPTSTGDGHADRRSPHVRVRRRRLPDGGRLARGLLARRHAGAGQADRALRRQRHLDRRPRRGLVPRRHAASASRPTAGT